MADLEPLYRAFRQIGEDPGLILASDTAHVVAYGHELLSRQSVSGVRVEAHADANGVHARIVVEQGRIIAQPVHLCFGLFERFGVQNVDLDVMLEADAHATFWSHCLFMFPDQARHTMDARIELGPGAPDVQRGALPWSLRRHRGRAAGEGEGGRAGALPG